MKLKTRKILLLNLNWINFLCVFFFLFINVSLAFCQDISLSFQDKKLSEAIPELALKLDIKVAFDSQAMSKYIVSGTFSGSNAEEIINKLISKTSFVSKRKFGNYLIVPKAVLSIKNIRISGTVKDKYTGEHLPYAMVSIPEKEQNFTASVNGTYSFQVDQTEEIHLNVRFMGYQNIDTIFTVLDTAMIVDLSMQQRNFELSTILIKQSRLKVIDQNFAAGHFAINPRSFADLPNMCEQDIFRTIQLLPGISYSENCSGLNIRGGTEDQNLVLFDGFTLYNLDHFFGTFSSINPNIVKDIQIYKGGFESRYGDRISGVIDITGKTGNKYQPKISGDLNLVSANLTAEFPLSKKLTLLVAGRRSYADIYSSYLVDDMLENNVQDVGSTKKSGSIVQLEPGYYFYDYNSKLTFNRSETEKMSISVFGGKDFLSSNGEGQRNKWFTKTTDDAKWGNYGLSYLWVKEWKKHLFSNLQIGYSGYQNNYDNLTEVNLNGKVKAVTINTFDSHEENKLSDFSVSLKNKYTFNLKNSIEFGLQLKNNDFTYIKDARADTSYSNISNSSWLYSSFLQLNTQPIKNLYIKIGGRFSGYNQSNKLFSEPRLSANYRIGKYFNMKCAIGKYYQFMSKVVPTQTYGYNRDFWVISDENIHPVQTADHYIFGASFNSNRFTFDVEAYSKSMTGLQMYLFVPQYQKNKSSGQSNKNNQAKTVLPSKFITGTGKALGLDFLLKYESANYTSWISYSISKSVRNFEEVNNNEDIPSPFEKKNEIKWTNLLNLKKWSFSSLWLYSTGRNHISNQRIDRNLNAILTYDELPNFKRFDIAANYSFLLRKTKIKLGVSVINLFNTENYNDIYSREFSVNSTSFNETTYVRSLGITPNFSINFQY